MFSYFIFKYSRIIITDLKAWSQQRLLVTTGKLEQFALLPELSLTRELQPECKFIMVCCVCELYQLYHWFVLRCHWLAWLNPTPDHPAAWFTPRGVAPWILAGFEGISPWHQSGMETRARLHQSDYCHSSMPHLPTPHHLDANKMARKVIWLLVKTIILVKS